MFSIQLSSQSARVRSCLGEEIPQPHPGGVEGAVGLIPLDPLALLVLAQVHAHVIDLADVVVRNVTLHSLSRHSDYLQIFLSKGRFPPELVENSP